MWLDQLDIDPGQRWARAVQDALNNCHRLLVILSPSSVNSTNVEDEVAFALEEHKTIIPVLYRECTIPFQLRPFQYVDFRTDYDGRLKTLLKTLGVVQQDANARRVAVSGVVEENQASDTDVRTPSAESARPEQERTTVAEEARLEQSNRETEKTLLDRLGDSAKSQLMTWVILVEYLVLAWFISGWLNLNGFDLWILRGGLAFLGLTGAGIVLWIQRKAALSEHSHQIAAGARQAVLYVNLLVIAVVLLVLYFGLKH